MLRRSRLNPDAVLRGPPMSGPEKGARIGQPPGSNQRTSQTTLHTSQNMQEAQGPDPPSSLQDEHNPIPHSRPLTP
eukprot:3320866-Pyramimonas_sp.AAC.1